MSQKVTSVNFVFWKACAPIYRVPSGRIYAVASLSSKRTSIEPSKVKIAPSRLTNAVFSSSSTRSTSASSPAKALVPTVFTFLPSVTVAIVARLSLSRKA